MILKPFYNPDGGDSTGVVEQAAPKSFFQQSGWVTKPFDQASETNTATVTTDEPSATVETSVASTGSDENNSPAPQQAAAQAEQPVTTTSPAVSAEAPTVAAVEKPWNEAIKEVEKSKVLEVLGSKREIMKSLGVSDFFLDMNDYYETHGNVDEYLNARGIDYNKYDDDAILRLKVEKENPTASTALRQRIFDHLVSQYKVDEETAQSDPVAIEFAAYNKKQAADAFRAVLQADQAKFSIPTKEVSNEAPVTKEQIIEAYKDQDARDRAASYDKWAEENLSNPVTKQIVADKKIEVMPGVFVGVDSHVQDILDFTSGKKNFVASKYLNEDGTPDMQKFYKLMAFVVDPEMYDKTILAEGKTQARKEDIAEGSASEAIASGAPGGVAQQSSIKNILQNGVTTSFV